MITQNQLNDYFTKQVGRTATPFEYEQYKGSDLQHIANIGNFYNTLNKDTSIVDYLKYTGQDSSRANMQTLGAKYGITNVGTAEGNTALLNALRSGQPAGTGQSTAPVAGSVSGASQSATGGDTSGQGVSGSVSGAAAPTPTETTELKDPLETALNDYQTVQKQVADIDKALDEALMNKRNEVTRSGGIVDESQLKSLVYKEKEPLLLQRKSLVAQQAQAGKLYQSLLSQQKLVNQNAQATARSIISSVAKGETDISTLDPAELARIEQEAGLPTGYLTHLKDVSAASSLSGEAIDSVANVVLQTGVIPSGFSRNPMIVAKIWNKVAELQMGTGINLGTQSAVYKGLSKAYSTLANQSETKEAYEKGVTAQIPILKTLSANVPRSDSPLFNKYAQAITKAVSGDSNLQLFHNSVETFVNEYAKIMAGGTASAAASTDSARQEAQTLLSTAFNNGTFNNALDLLKLEMDTRIQGNEEQMNELQDKMNQLATGNYSSNSSGGSGDGGFADNW